MTPQLNNFIHTKIMQQPHLPREVSFNEILPAVLRINSMKFLLVFLLILSLACFGIGIFYKSNQILFLIFGSFALLLSFTPFIYALRITKAIRIGHIKVATVESVHYEGPHSVDTLDSLENGMACGKWRVPSVGLLEFEVDEPWAKKLSVGSRVELLVANDKTNNVFPLKLKSV